MCTSRQELFDDKYPCTSTLALEARRSRPAQRRGAESVSDALAERPLGRACPLRPSPTVPQSERLAMEESSRELELSYMRGQALLNQDTAATDKGGGTPRGRQGALSAP